jgi:MFS transporter, MHS family, proline/betaine transporter
VKTFSSISLINNEPTPSKSANPRRRVSLLKTAYSGVLPSLMAELFPTRTRGTGVALSYNVSVPIFGGFAPFFAALLIQLTGDRHAPSFYLMLTALISLAALVAVRSRLHLK